MHPDIGYVENKHFKDNEIKESIHHIEHEWAHLDMIEKDVGFVFEEVFESDYLKREMAGL